jgi:hypothetical protein
LSTKPKEANQKMNVPSVDPISPFSPTWWEYTVPFLVYFNKPFSAETRVFYHKVPTAFSPAVLFVRSACNILLIISTIIFRFQAMSYNAKMFNLTPTWNLPFDPNPNGHNTGEVVTEAAVCKAVASPKIYYPVNGVLQYNFEMIHTPMMLNFFIVCFMALAVKSFSVTQKSLETLQNVGLELKRYPLKYHNGGENESSYSLWFAINNIWVEEMMSSKDFFSQMMGFQDFELDHSTGRLNPKLQDFELDHSTGRLNPKPHVKSGAAKRLLILSLIPLLLTFIVPVTYQLATDPATGKALGIPCLAQSCLDLFSASVIGRCDTASNTTVWRGESGYYETCLKCDIMIHGSFSKAAYYFIMIFSEHHD